MTSNNPLVLLLFYAACSALGLWGGWAIVRRKRRRLQREADELARLMKK